MGVKSLWSLLTPVGRPVMLETVEGKSMAIDSSIWIYQFQATMRDKEGRGLVNAHVLGFLRRICKLLFYGIKPVFVFDGGAPALKRMTITERKKKKSGAADSHAKIAEKLLAAQLRREALNHAQSSSGTAYDKGKAPRGPVALDDDTVYLEDLDGSNPTPTPAKDKGKAKETSVSPTKKSKWHDHDPYRLPDIDMEAAVAKATRSTAPDPRLATEDELRVFIEMMRPEDLDVNSHAFRELPTEVQYEIIGDLRLKSRQTSHKRLQAMLRNSRTALDFSRAQISNLKQRNALTQQLLETTDSIGNANVTIPIRIASERNREYLLVKNEGEVGGWVLGIRDDGTQDKPIVIDNADEHMKSDQESGEDDMEEVAIPQTAVVDSDLREYRRELALGGTKVRQAIAAARGRPTATPATKMRSPRKEPLFIPDADEDGNIDIDYETDSNWEDVEDAEMITAIQASLEDQETNELRKAVEESRKTDLNKLRGFPSPNGASLSRQHDLQASDSDDDLYDDFTPSRLDTALRFANTSRDSKISPPAAFSWPSLLVPSPPSNKSVATGDDDEDEDMEEVEVPFQSAFTSSPQRNIQSKEAGQASQTVSRRESEGILDLSSMPVVKTNQAISPDVTPVTRSDENYATAFSEAGLDPTRGQSIPADAPSATLDKTPEATTAPVTTGTLTRMASSSILDGPKETATVAPSVSAYTKSETSFTTRNTQHLSPSSVSLRRENDSKSDIQESTTHVYQSAEQSNPEASSDDEAWSRPSNPGGSEQEQDSVNKQDEGWDAAEEMNVHEETGEFARFAAQVRGRDLDSVRNEIEDEIRQLQQQRKAAMRDSEDVTQAMIAQIMTMLRLFGIPYITSPMEAEAQCATLVDLGLVDGVITDDSDVFLFGAKRVFKNMFNQAKTVECFLLTDLSRELGLDRGTLVRLAYLLGSDYVTGLPGVGPVVAMELLREFPGDDGLHKFKDWWTKVQSGRDKDSDNVSTFRKRFKKRFKDLYLPTDWPNAAVLDAYYHPVVDNSEEPFKWGLPDLDGLRSFFREELSWNAGKVDELLLPIIQKMNKRGQDAASNRQGTLNDFFAVSEGSGAAEPRRREAYASRRLQALVTAHRKAQKQRSEGTEPEESEKEETQPVKKRRKKVSSVEGDEGSRETMGRGRGRGRGGATRGRRGRGAKTQMEDRNDDSTFPPEPKLKKATKAKPKAKGRSGGGAHSGSDSSDEFVPGSAPDAGPVREMALRKRARPRPAYKRVERGKNGEDRMSVNGEGGGGKETGLDVVDSGSEGSAYQE